MAELVPCPFLLSWPKTLVDNLTLLLGILPSVQMAPALSSLVVEGHSLGANLLSYFLLLCSYHVIVISSCFPPSHTWFGIKKPSSLEVHPSWMGTGKGYKALCWWGLTWWNLISNVPPYSPPLREFFRTFFSNNDNFFESSLVPCIYVALYIHYPLLFLSITLGSMWSFSFYRWRNWCFDRLNNFPRFDTRKWQNQDLT